MQVESQALSFAHLSQTNTSIGSHAGSILIIDFLVRGIGLFAKARSIVTGCEVDLFWRWLSLEDSRVEIGAKEGFLRFPWISKL